MHIVLVIVFMIERWYHMYLLHFGHMEWLHAGIAAWTLDRFMRFVRIFNLKIAWSKGLTARKAHLQPDTVKAHVKVGYNFSFRPWQYVYIYFQRFNFLGISPLYHCTV